jgi:uncharacterized protein
VGSDARAGIEERVRAATIRGLAWTMYEPNNEALWARVSDEISNLLISYWRDGELVGMKREEAFFVRCGRDTMTQQDLDDGRLIVLVGIAPVAPAEFVVIRIEQMVGGQRRKRLLRRWLAWARIGSA